MNVNKQSLVYTVIFTFSMAFIFVLLLSFAHQSTVELVEQNRDIARQRSILTAMDISFSDDDDVREKFADVEQVERNGVNLFRTETDDGVVYAKEFVGAGLWGAISGVLAVNDDIDRTIGLEIVDNNETPGLGGRITEAWFKEQLRGQKIVDGTVSVGSPGEGDTDKDDGEIDAITGATRTSERMGVIFRDEISKIADALGKSL